MFVLISENEIELRNGELKNFLTKISYHEKRS